MRLLKLAAGAAALLLAGQAHAATWLVNYSSADAPTAATLTVTTADTQNAVFGYDVLSITGDVAGDTVLGMIGGPSDPPSYSADGLFIYDNMMFASSRPVSYYGLFFKTASLEYNLFSDDAKTYHLYSATPGVGFGANSVGSLGIGGKNNPLSNGVPEPAAWTMMIMGFGGIGAMLRRRQAVLAHA